MRLTKKSPEVYLAEGPIAKLGQDDMQLLRQGAANSPRGRVRINVHPSEDDMLHEMFIAIRQNSYIRPHLHPGKSEAFHIVQGVVDIVVFQEDGTVRDVVPLGDGHSGRAFYYRMSRPFFHTLLIRSDFLIVHEITNGPFLRGGTRFAPFAPEEGDADGAADYLRRLLPQVASFAQGCEP
jgi:cupin fold WbuC family metalloprotein